MKKIILIFLILLISNFAYSDCEDNDCTTEYLALGINNPITIPGGAGEAGEIDYLINESFNDCADVDCSGTFVENDEDEWTIVSGDAQYVIGAADDNGYIYVDLPSEYDELTVQFDLKLSDVAIAEDTVDRMEVFWICDASNKVISKIMWYGASSCSDPCGLDRARYYYLEDSGFPNDPTTTGISEITQTFANDTYVTWKLYYKRDTGGASQGIVRVWIGGNLEYENTAVDNNDSVTQIDKVVIGPFTADTSPTASYPVNLTINNLKVFNGIF